MKTLFKFAALAAFLGTLAGCGTLGRLFPPPPPLPPPWAAITLLEPVQAKCRVMDDTGQTVDMRVTVPAGWRLLKPRLPE